ncbi:DoxX family protein [Segniliparus rugosus]|uniref:DoxX-like family protein n=1 Tax=Segniliparus rugosus (strain ATCC BAA-974 / DSM 45345 / CCUG 50838 / CIP 108380 / JCM 13579 / CDC 945) TaxID=679197 RepID=E5XPB6_SEGRC|nr:DoxX family protein [Segniliparus rugosus]EFV13807.1 hypothetical protein HMPREF9336_01338 [Segniliparus rugosus ATCC BAA-974]
MSRKPSPKTLAAFAALQAADAVACAIPVKAIAEAFDRVEVPVKYRWLFPVVKGASAAGLALGAKFPPVARLTLALLTVYFVAAVGSHVRVRDSIPNSAAAAVLLGTYGYLAAQSFVAKDEAAPVTR